MKAAASHVGVGVVGLNVPALKHDRREHRCMCVTSHHICDTPIGYEDFGVPKRLSLLHE